MNARPTAHLTALLTAAVLTGPAPGQLTPTQLTPADLQPVPTTRVSGPAVTRENPVLKPMTRSPASRGKVNQDVIAPRGFEAIPGPLNDYRADKPTVKVWYNDVIRWPSKQPPPPRARPGKLLPLPESIRIKHVQRESSRNDLTPSSRIPVESAKIQNPSEGTDAAFGPKSSMVTSPCQPATRFVKPNINLPTLRDPEGAINQEAARRAIQEAARNGDVPIRPNDPIVIALPIRLGPAYCSDPKLVVPVEIKPLDDREDGLAAALAGDYKLAHRLLQTHLVQSPDDTEARRAAAFALLMNGDTAEGSRLLARTYALDPLLAQRPFDAAQTTVARRKFTPLIATLTKEATTHKSADRWLSAAILMHLDGRSGATNAIDRARACGLNAETAEAMLAAFSIKNK